MSSSSESLSSPSQQRLNNNFFLPSFIYSNAVDPKKVLWLNNDSICYTINEDRFVVIQKVVYNKGVAADDDARHQLFIPIDDGFCVSSLSTLTAAKEDSSSSHITSTFLVLAQYHAGENSISKILLYDTTTSWGESSRNIEKSPTYHIVIPCEFGRVERMITFTDDGNWYILALTKLMVKTNDDNNEINKYFLVFLSIKRQLLLHSYDLQNNAMNFSPLLFNNAALCLTNLKRIPYEFILVDELLDNKICLTVCAMKGFHYVGHETVKCTVSTSNQENKIIYQGSIFCKRVKDSLHLMAADDELIVTSNLYGVAKIQLQSLFKVISTSSGLLVLTSDGIVQNYDLEVHEGAMAISLVGECTLLGLHSSECVDLSFIMNSNETCLCIVPKDGGELNVLHLQGKFYCESINSSHNGGVIDMCCSDLHGVLVTIGLDGARIYDMRKYPLRLSFSFPLDDCPESASIHPSGDHLTIGFRDGIKVYNILRSSLSIVLDISAKGCSCVCLNKAGSYIAYGQGSSIHIINFYEGSPVNVIAGQYGKVFDLSWEDDYTLISSYEDGVICVWKIHCGSKIKGPIKLENPMYLSRSVSGLSLFLISKSRKIILGVHQETMGIEQRWKAKTDELFLSVVSSSCDDQSILPTHAFISVHSNGRKALIEFPCEGEKGSEIFCLPISPTGSPLIINFGQYLLLSDKSGAILFFPLSEILTITSHNHSKSLVYNNTSVCKDTNIVLVSKADLEEIEDAAFRLENRLGDLNMQNEYQRRLHEKSHEAKVKEVTENFTQLVDQSRSKLLVLKEEIMDLETDYNEKLESTREKNRVALLDMEQSNQNEILQGVERYQSLLKQSERSAKEQDCSRSALLERHKNSLSDMKHRFDQELAIKVEEFKLLESDLNRLKEQHTREVESLEEDIDSKIQNLKEELNKKLATEKELSVRFNSDIGILSKRLIALQKDMEDQKEEIRILLEKEDELQNDINTLKSQHNTQKEGVMKQNAIIHSKTEELKSLESQKENLDKFRFVLEFKMKELKSQIAPQEKQVQLFQSKLNTLNAQVQEELRQTENYHKQMEDAVRDTHFTHTYLLEQTRHVKTQTSFLEQIKTKLQDCSQLIQYPEKMEMKVLEMLNEIDRYYHNNHWRPRTYEEEDKSDYLNGGDDCCRDENKEHNDAIEINKLKLLKREYDRLQLMLRIEERKRQQKKEKLIEQNMELLKNIKQRQRI